MSVKVFVYGTLRTGDCRFGVETFVEMVAPEAYAEGFEMLDLGGFPGLVQFDGHELHGLPRVRGEVHEYEDLSVLDRIEGYCDATPEKGLYTRVQVDIDTPDGVIEDCWVYVFNGGSRVPSGWLAERDRIIQSGDWFEHRGYYAQLEIENGG